MNTGLLDSSCVVLIQSNVQDRFNPNKVVWNPFISNVACRLDTLLMSAVTKTIVPGTTELNMGGLMWINGDYGEGSVRKFNEKNAIRINGFDFNIKAIHDVHGMSGLDHYEIEVERRALGGTP